MPILTYRHEDNKELERSIMTSECNNVEEDNTRISNNEHSWLDNNTEIASSNNKDVYENFDNCYGANSFPRLVNSTSTAFPLLEEDSELLLTITPYHNTDNNDNDNNEHLHHRNNRRYVEENEIKYHDNNKVSRDNSEVCNSLRSPSIRVNNAISELLHSDNLINDIDKKYFKSNKFCSYKREESSRERTPITHESNYTTPLSKYSYKNVKETSNNITKTNSNEYSRIKTRSDLVQSMSRSRDREYLTDAIAPWKKTNSSLSFSNHFNTRRKLRSHAFVWAERASNTQRTSLYDTLVNCNVGNHVFRDSFTNGEKPILEKNNIDAEERYSYHLNKHNERNDNSNKNSSMWEHILALHYNRKSKNETDKPTIAKFERIHKDEIIQQNKLKSTPSSKHENKSLLMSTSLLASSPSSTTTTTSSSINDHCQYHNRDLSRVIELINKDEQQQRVREREHHFYANTCSAHDRSSCNERPELELFDDTQRNITVEQSACANTHMAEKSKHTLISPLQTFSSNENDNPQVALISADRNENFANCGINEADAVILTNKELENSCSDSLNESAKMRMEMEKSKFNGYECEHLETEVCKEIDRIEDSVEDNNAHDDDDNSNSNGMFSLNEEGVDLEVSSWHNEFVLSSDEEEETATPPPSCSRAFQSSKFSE